MKHVKKIIATLSLVTVMGTMIIGCSSSSEPSSNSEPSKKEDTNANVDSEDSKDSSEENVEVNAADVIAGSEMSSAGELPFNAKATGLVESGKTAWYSFTTDSTERGTYKVLSENITDGEETTMEVVIYDEDGTALAGDYNYVKNDGQVGTATLEKADANTTYYIGINVKPFDNDCDYNITVKPAKK